MGGGVANVAVFTAYRIHNTGTQIRAKRKMNFQGRGNNSDVAEDQLSNTILRIQRLRLRPPLAISIQRPIVFSCPSLAPSMISHYTLLSAQIDGSWRSLTPKRVSSAE